MADDVEMTPIDASELTPVTAAEPPKVNPLAKAGVKLPPKTNVTAKLKLPPKPGLATGLKLPPKPGLSTGLKLPPKPGATIVAKPVIRKPGAGLTIPKPVAPVTPVAPPAAPAAPATPAAPTATATPVPPPAPSTAKPLDALKAVTQNLKGVTQAIPQQAILHKTGIIADGVTTETQKEAAKHKTARISLSDAMGVAPVKDEHAPMKTIRIKRPINIPGASKLTEAAATVAPTTATTTTGGASPTPATSVTQRKTLKITRPGAVRPTGKFGNKTSVSQATTVAKATVAPESQQLEEVADIPELTATPPVPHPVTVSDVPSWMTTLSTIIEVAACVAIAALVWYFYKDAQLPTFCGGLGWQV